MKTIYGYEVKNLEDVIVLRPDQVEAELERAMHNDKYAAKWHHKPRIASNLNRVVRCMHCELNMYEHIGTPVESCVRCGDADNLKEIRYDT